MKRILLAVLILLVPLAALAQEGGNPVKSDFKLTPETPVVKVNGKIVRYLRYQQAMKKVLTAMRSGGKHQNVGMEKDSVRSEVMAKIVERELLYAESIKDPMPDLDEEAKKSYQRFVENFPSEETFKKNLAASGMVEKDLQELIREDVAINWYITKKMVPEIGVTDEEAKSFYDATFENNFNVPERVNISHILREASKDPEVDAAVVKLLEELRQRIMEGENFKVLAVEFNQDHMTKEYAGLLGPRKRDELPPEVAQACFALKEGEVSEVVKTQFGYHIFILNERMEPLVISFDEVKDSIKEHIRKKKLEEQLENLMVELGTGSTIEVLLPHF